MGLFWVGEEVVKKLIGVFRGDSNHGREDKENADCFVPRSDDKISYNASLEH